MSAARRLHEAHVALRAAFRDERGTSAVEIAIVLPVFLLILFGILDFGRLAITQVLAQKATQDAVRIAVVRPTVCDVGKGLLPRVNHRPPSDAADVPMGTKCNASDGVCAAPASVACRLSQGGETATEIWARVHPLLPGNARPENLLVTYAYDKNIGFLGGPYTPIVSVELVDLPFDFVTPLSAIGKLAGGDGSAGVAFDFFGIGVSMPAEDLAQGV